MSVDKWLWIIPGSGSSFLTEKEMEEYGYNKDDWEMITTEKYNEDCRTLWPRRIDWLKGDELPTLRCPVCGSKHVVWNNNYDCINCHNQKQTKRSQGFCAETWYNTGKDVERNTVVFDHFWPRESESP